jgi:hypothetical protein
MINGRRFSMSGVDLKSKIIKSKYTGNTISTTLFTTKAINLILTVVNTASTYCTRNAPVATVQL